MECSNDKPCKKLIRSKSGLRIVVTDVDYRSPFEMCEPVWTPDKEVSNCMKCSAKFGFTTRKHHCRRCGHIYCSACCDEKLDLPRMCFIDPVRVCHDCAPATIEENKFFECHLKILIAGASFMLSSSRSLQEEKYKKSLELFDNPLAPIDGEDVEVICKLSQDHRYLVFDGVDIGEVVSPLPLDRIRSLRVYNDVPTVHGLFLENENDSLTTTGAGGVATSIELEYVREMISINTTETDAKEVTSLLRLSTPLPFDATQANHQKQSAMWIVALQQAFKLIYKKSKPEEAHAT